MNVHIAVNHSIPIPIIASAHIVAATSIRQLIDLSNVISI